MSESRSTPPLVVVTGTSTGVGKTFVACALARALIDAGVRVAARKPVESFDPAVDRPDSEALSMITGEQPDEICDPRYRYEIPMAPPLAALELNRPAPQIGELLNGLGSWPDWCQLGIVELAGGLRSPIAIDGDGRDLIAKVDARPVLVAHAGLGAINAVRVSMDSLERSDCLVYLNWFDADDVVHRTNYEWLSGEYESVHTSIETLARLVAP